MGVRRVAVIGGGPAGIYAAWGAARRGFDVALYEESSIGASMKRWGPLRLFTPMSMNAPRDLLDELRVDGLDDLTTGPELIDRVLEPATRHPLLAGRAHSGTSVLAVGRRGVTKMDFAGHPMRAEKPFRLLLHSDSGEEWTESDLVLDASGGYAIPAPAGAGGIPAPGEASSVEYLIRHLGDLHRRLPDLAGKSVLLAGNGHSAAHALLWMIEARIDVVWAVRTTNRRPCAEIANDPLPERRAIASRANDLAENPPSNLRIERRAMIERITPIEKRARVVLTGDRTVDVDCIAAFTGWTPRADHLSALQIETSPVTGGTARLWRALSSITDCLAAPRVGPEDLQTGEPGYFFVGSRSYGRAPTFLLQAGMQQIDTILEGLKP
ncbi:MAG TPA: FAD-dependent oxidoreductase [Thermoanaerobaculia bacterium]|nr:FAD-dependent oxidoreductase [Thermoanaerobaculia bacterium]